ncbi:MAG: hypothetical protein WHX52_22980 [Anaerolineae bacterium]
MSLLREAKAGDIVTRLKLDNTQQKLSGEHFVFDGRGNYVLSALRRSSDISANPRVGATIDVNSVYPGVGQGLVLTRFSQTGDVSVQGVLGKGTSASVHVVSKAETYLWSAVKWAVEALLVKYCPFKKICAGIVAGEEIFDLTEGLWPKAGDNELMMTVFENRSQNVNVVLGSVGTHSYRFRNGLQVDYSEIYVNNVYGRSPVHFGEE